MTKNNKDMTVTHLFLNEYVPVRKGSKLYKPVVRVEIKKNDKRD